MFMTPQRAELQRPDHVEKFSEIINANSLEDSVTGRSAIEAGPDEATERTVFGVAHAGERSVAAIAERANGRACEARTGCDHEWASHRVHRSSGDEIFVHT